MMIVLPSGSTPRFAIELEATIDGQESAPPPIIGDDDGLKLTAIIGP